MKRIFDIVLSIIAILLLFPFFIVISLLIVVESRGSAFYRQCRVGRNQVDFMLLKFRTMYVNSDKLGLLTISNRDVRITRIGYFLRKYKIDEFPQFINILLGDMSFVGPRPEVRKYVDLYSNEQLKVLQVKPGLTDLASLKYYNENEFLSKFKDPEIAYINTVMPHKIQLNLEYIQKRSFIFDVKIILQTLFKWVK